jgi:hypothetical protein
MLPITCKEEDREGSKEELIGTSAVVMTSGHEEVGCSCCCCLCLRLYILNSLSLVC